MRRREKISHECFWRHLNAELKKYGRSLSLTSRNLSQDWIEDFMKSFMVDLPIDAHKMTPMVEKFVEGVHLFKMFLEIVFVGFYDSFWSCYTKSCRVKWILTRWVCFDFSVRILVRISSHSFGSSECSSSLRALLLNRMQAGVTLRGAQTEWNSSILNVLKLNKTVHHHVAYLLLYMNPYLDFLIQAHFVYKLGLKRHYYQFFY